MLAFDESNADEIKEEKKTRFGQIISRKKALTHINNNSLLAIATPQRATSALKSSYAYNIIK